MALLLVVAVVALASVLGFCMLSNAMLQNRASGNAGRASSADYLAESGLNIALYYLQYPASAPSLNGSGYWSGTNGYIAVNSAIPGTVQVTVVRDANDQWSYEVTSASSVTNTYSGLPITRTLQARVYVQNEFVVKQGASFNSAATLVAGTSVTGDVICSKNLALKTGSPNAVVTGVGYCKTYTLPGIGFTQPQTSPYFVKNQPGSNVAPAAGEASLYYPTYKYNNVTYNTDVIPTSVGTLSGSVGVVTKTSSGTNPAGVWYRNANSVAFALGSNVTINGTLVVDGDLQINGANITINAATGYPALIVKGTMEIIQPSNSITINGVCFVGNVLKSSGSSPVSTITINGALISGNTGNSSPFSTGYNATTVIKYDTTKIKCPDLTWALRQSKGVSIVRWGPP